jgi:hypothetical protein
VNRPSDQARPDERRPSERDERASGREREAERRPRSPWPDEPVLHDA